MTLTLITIPERFLKITFSTLRNSKT